MKIFSRSFRRVIVLGVVGLSSFSCAPVMQADEPEIVVWAHQSSNQLRVARETTQPFYIMAYRRGMEIEGATEVEVDIPANWQIWLGSEAPPADSAGQTRRVQKYPLSLRATKDTAASREYSASLAAGNLLMVVRPPVHAELVHADDATLHLRWRQGDRLLAERSVALKPVELKAAFDAPPDGRPRVGMWMNDPKFNPQTMNEVYRGLRRSGVDYVIISREMYRQSGDLLRELGIKVFINQWWSYHAYVPQAPPLAAHSTLKNGTIDEKRWSPTYMAEGGAEFIKSVEGIADELKQMEGISGFMLDYEPGAIGLDADYGPQSRAAFERQLKQKVAAWPADVLDGGRHEEAWINFRVAQSEAYIRWFRDILKQRAPGVLLAVSTSGATGTADDPNRRLAATDIIEFSRYVDSIHPQLYSWTSQLPQQLERFNDKLNLGRSTLAGAHSSVYPAVGSLAGRNPLAEPEYLRTQILNWWFRGASGFEVWQYFYGVDGRYMALINEMAHLFKEAGEAPAASASGNTVLDAPSAAGLEILSRQSADGKTAWVGIFNFDSKPASLALKTKSGWQLDDAEEHSVTIAPWTTHIVRCRRNATQN